MSSSLFYLQGKVLYLVAFTFILFRATQYPIDAVYDRVRLLVARIILRHGRFLHSWTITGLDLLPREGPALVVYYHGVVPVDYIYLVAAVYMKTGILVF